MIYTYYYGVVCAGKDCTQSSVTLVMGMTNFMLLAVSAFTLKQRSVCAPVPRPAIQPVPAPNDGEL